MTIETLSIARDLRATDLPPEQAEAVEAATGRAVTESSATKGDLDLARAGLEAKTEYLRTSLDAKVEQVRASLEIKIEALRTEVERTRNQILLGVISSQVALAGIIIAVIKL